MKINKPDVNRLDIWNITPVIPIVRLLKKNKPRLITVNAIVGLILKIIIMGIFVALILIMVVKIDDYHQKTNDVRPLEDAWYDYPDNSHVEYYNDFADE